MNHNFNIEKIHDSIWVFKKAYSYGKDLIDYYENLPPLESKEENWQNWYEYGNHRKILTPGPLWDSFPEKELFTDQIFKEIHSKEHKNSLIKEVLDLFYETTKMYVEEQNIIFPNWKWEAFDIASYNPGAGAGPDHGMAFHSDYQQEKHDEPGVKFGLTCLFYLNDNYGSGEIIFKELSEDLSKVVWRGRYKPSEGDILIFPSAPPIFHATRKCTENKKYLLRLYWRYEDEGLPSYWEERSKFTDENEWEIYLKDRRKSIGFERGRLINNSDTEINREGIYE